MQFKSFWELFSKLGGHKKVSFLKKCSNFLRYIYVITVTLSLEGPAKMFPPTAAAAAAAGAAATTTTTTTKGGKNNGYRQTNARMVYIIKYINFFDGSVKKWY